MKSETERHRLPGTSPAGDDELRLAGNSGGWITALLLMCTAVSGVAALLYQVAWNRQFLTLFGSTTAATAAVVAAFMGGMALGAAWLARYTGRLREPLLLYAVLELVIAGYALVFPFILSLGDGLYADLWQAIARHPLGLNLLRLILGMVLLAVPTLAMGATLPLLVHLLRPAAAGTARAAAWAYGLNAGGGAAGAVAAGLVLIPWLGLASTVALGIGLSLTVVTVAGLMWWRLPAGNGSGRDTFLRVDNGGERITRNRWLLIAALLLSGFAAMGYEVLWTRMLVLVTGSSTYAFTLMLSLYIAGLAVGSLWIARRIDRLRSPGLVFAHLQLAVAAAVAGGLWLFGHFPGLLLGWYQDWGISFSSSLVANALFAGLIVLPPTILLGAAFPVAVRLWAGDTTGPTDGGGAAGRAYGWMTAGNVVGALATGGGLIVWLGLQGSVLKLAAVSALAAVAAVLALRGGGRARWLTLAAGLTAASVLIILKPQWDEVTMTSGVYKEAPLYLGLAGNENQLGTILSAYTSLYYKEGNQAVVSVVERPTLKETPHRVLAIDGKVDASTGADMSTQILSGHLPLLLHPDPRSVLVIGLASGVTAGAVTQHAGVEAITLAEIEPAVVEAARQFAPFNHDVLTDPRLTLVLDDGRHYLGVTPKRFDVIISEPSNPWMSGPARLFTHDFFEQARTHLNTGGVYAQWLPLYGLSTPLLKTEIRTFLNVFPHVALFHVSAGDLLLLGSGRPLYSPPVESLPSAVQADLARVGLNASALLARFITGERGLATWVGAGPVNTDDNALLEFGAPRFLLSDTLETNRTALVSVPWEADLLLWATGHYAQNAVDTTHLLRLAREYLATGQPDKAEFLAGFIENTGEAQEILGDVAAGRSHWITAKQHWTSAGTPGARLALARRALMEGSPAEAQRELSAVPAAARSERFYYLQGLTGLALGDDADASEALARIVRGTASVPQLLASYLRSASARRLGHGLQAEKLEQDFQQLLDVLRQQLEREQGQPVMERLLVAVSNREWLGLTGTEHRRLLQAISTRLSDPLAIYYRGVSQLWLGQTSAAATVLNDYLARLPPGSASHARLLLRQ